MSKRRAWELVSSTVCLISPLFFLHLYIYIVPLIYSHTLATHIHLIPHSRLSAYVQERSRKHIAIIIMNTQNSVKDDPDDEVSNNWNYTKEKPYGKAHKEWPQHNNTDFTKGWRMATHETADGEPQQSWCTAPPTTKSRQPDDITLVVSVDEAHELYTITPCFPAKNDNDAKLWADPKIVSDALAQTETILTEINPSALWNVEKETLQSGDAETRLGWHISALNTLARELNKLVEVDSATGPWPVHFDPASRTTSIEPNTHYLNRKDIIGPPPKRHFLHRDRASTLYAQLPFDHPSYRPLKSKVTAQESQVESKRSEKRSRSRG